MQKTPNAGLRKPYIATPLDIAVRKYCLEHGYYVENNSTTVKIPADRRKEVMSYFMQSYPVMEVTEVLSKYM